MQGPVYGRVQIAVIFAHIRLKGEETIVRVVRSLARRHYTNERRRESALNEHRTRLSVTSIKSAAYRARRGGAAE